MTSVLIADVFVLAGLLITLSLVGLVLGGHDDRGPRMQTLLWLAIAVTVIAAGRQQETNQTDFVSWTLAAVSLPRLWWPRHSSHRHSFSFLAIALGVTALILTLMWGAR